MNVKRVVRIAIDCAMAAVLVALMATALVQEAPHEWLGIALIGLVAAHIVLNLRWLGAAARARHSALQVLQLVVLAGFFACIIALFVSSLVVSKHAFGFLPTIPGAAWARRVHMVCSYWAFMLAFAHAGLHMRLPKLDPPWRKWVARIACAVAACLGAYSFARLGLGTYLAGQVQFAFADPSVPLALQLARYASVGVLVSGIFHYIREALITAARRKQRN